MLKDLSDAVINTDKTLLETTIKNGLDAGIEPLEMIENGLSRGMQEVGMEFEMGRRFLPQLMMSANLMTDAVKELQEYMGNEKADKIGTIVLGVVEGDVHDIGKNIVKIFLSVNGFEVIDLGRDVLITTFITKAKEVNADIIATSALMTSTMVAQKSLEEMLKEQGLKNKYRTLIGGAPCTEHWAEKIGADAYAEDAASAYGKALELMNK
ncbi:MAG: corrinoid protein [Methanosarcinaceae archaeon]|nr:corrinoid protein [Methanosarcinaceae archaeon]